MITTNFLGLKLKNPVIVGAGTRNRDGSSIKKMLNAGAGAVVTESVLSDVRLEVRPRLAYNGSGVQNIRLYSQIQIEGWERELDIAKSGGGIVIASVTAHTPSELAYLATKMEKFGADAIEINVSSPHGEELETAASHPDRVFEMTREVVSNVKIPVMVKLSQIATDISAVAKAVKEAGGSGVSAINTIRCILAVDIDHAMPTLSAYGGYSGPPIRPIGLASVATIAQSVDIPVCGIGGIENYKNVLEYIMLGASAVQLGTTVMMNGPDRITEIVHDLENWAEKHHLASIEDIQGKALKNLKSFDEMKIEPVICHALKMPCPEDCQLCVKGCVYEAISRKEDTICVDEELCTGCGLCVAMCPATKLKLDW